MTRSVVAAGYVSIGDGRRRTGVTGPARATSTSSTPTTCSTITSSIPSTWSPWCSRSRTAARRLPPRCTCWIRDQTMADVPDIAGRPHHVARPPEPLLGPQRQPPVGRGGQRLSASPRGTLRPTPPMMHVWLTDHPCGPFSGVEGHGAGDEAIVRPRAQPLSRELERPGRS